MLFERSLKIRFSVSDQKILSSTFATLLATTTAVCLFSGTTTEAKRQHHAVSHASHRASASAHHTSSRSTLHLSSTRHSRAAAHAHTHVIGRAHHPAHHITHTAHYRHAASSSYPEPHAENVQNSSSLTSIYHLYDRGVNERLEGHPEQATRTLLEAYSSYVSTQKNLTLEAMINYELGQAAEASSNYSVAADAYGRTLRIKPNMIEASVRLASLLMKAGHPELALSRAKEAVAMYPNDPRAHEILSLVLDKTGANGDAKSERDSTRSLIKSGSSINSQPADKSVEPSGQSANTSTQTDVPSALAPALAPSNGGSEPPKPVGEPVDNDVMP